MAHSLTQVHITENYLTHFKKMCFSSWLSEIMTNLSQNTCQTWQYPRLAVWHWALADSQFLNLQNENNHLKGFWRLWNHVTIYANCLLLCGAQNYSLKMLHPFSPPKYILSELSPLSLASGCLNLTEKKGSGFCRIPNLAVEAEGVHSFAVRYKKMEPRSVEVSYSVI